MKFQRMAADVSRSAEIKTPEELVDILTGEKVEETAMTKNTYTWGDSDTKALILIDGKFAKKIRNPFKKKIWKSIAARMRIVIVCVL